LDTLNPRAGIGGNNPPPYDPDVLAELLGRTDEFMRVSTEIRQKHNPIETEAQTQLLTDHISGLRGLKRQVDDARKAAKKPHDDAGNIVQEAFMPVLDRIERAVTAMLALQTDFLSRKAEEERKRKAEEQARADAARAEAERLAKEAAASGDLDAEAEADRKAKEADDLAKQASRKTKVNAASATGGGRTVGLVKVREAKITNIRLLFLHYHSRPEVAELLTRLANADIRAKDVDDSLIPGIEIIETEKAR
jgi:hypothetical protein